jgi:hypothetical protein
MSLRKPTIGKTTVAYATNGSTNIPLIFGDGVMLKDANSKGKILYISGRDVFLPDVIVKTDYDEFAKMIKDVKHKASHIFPQVWNAIKKVDADKLYIEQGEDWGNLMNDIVIYYACRFVLFKTPAPVIKVE